MSAEDACRRTGSSVRARPPDDVQHIGKYRLIKTIGRGNFAKVKLAKHVPTGRQVMKCNGIIASLGLLTSQLVHTQFSGHFFR